ncbi:hypothetical protein [Nocardia nova]|uniref:hypothetical protein n=1 Tax=Nocardia nova TaxID=37330 RepID=UPI00046D5363|nr:hypothetical protein [Nocardia nova]
MTTLLIIAVVAAVGAGVYDSVAPGLDRAEFRRALRRARHSLTDWDEGHDGGRPCRPDQIRVRPDCR